MDEEPDKIKQHIAEERENLGRNLDEIEYRFKDATDLRSQFNRHTAWFLGAAAGSGFLLALALGKSSARRNWQANVAERERPLSATPMRRPVSTHLNRVSNTVDDIVAGLVGVFSDKLQSMVGDVVPGFREQYDTISRRDRSIVR